MCDIGEVREAIKRGTAPKWQSSLNNFLGAGIFALLAWLLYNAHITETAYGVREAQSIKATTKREKEASKLSDARNTVNLLAIATLTREVAVLSVNVANIKEAAFSKMADRYTGKQALSDKALFNERCDASNRRHDDSQKRHDKTDRRFERLEKDVKDYHFGREL